MILMRHGSRVSSARMLAVVGTVTVLLVAQCAGFTPISKHRHARTNSPSSLMAHSSLLLSSNSTPSDSDPVFDTIMRFELKQELLRTSDEFKLLQQEMFDAKNEEKKTNKRQWFRRGGTKDSDPIGGAFGAQSFASIKVDLGDKGEEVIALAERLSTLSMNEKPLVGWKGYDNVSPEECAIDGKWKLRFTSGADATFPDSPKRGRATTSQIVDASEGTLTNAVDFETGKVKGFCVVVEGDAVSEKEMNLKFKKVIINRESRFPRLFGRITIRLPSFRILSAYARFASRGKSTRSSGPGFEIQYTDNDLRMHKTRDGVWFIQTRLIE